MKQDPKKMKQKKVGEAESAKDTITVEWTPGLAVHYTKVAKNLCNHT